MSALAVVVSVYRGDNLDDVVQAFESLAESEGDKKLLIGVDGPVGAETDRFLDGFAADHAEAEVIRFPVNRGLAHVLNDLIDRALLDADCRYVARMDADDLCEPPRFVEQMTALDSRPTLAVLGSWATKIDAEGREIGLIRKSNDERTLKRGLSFDSPFVHPSVMIRAAVLRQGYRYPTDTIRFEDVALWSRLAIDGHEFGNLQQPLLRYRFSTATAARRTGRRKIGSETRVRFHYLWKTSPYRLDLFALVFGIAAAKLVCPPRLLRHLIRLRTAR